MSLHVPSKPRLIRKVKIVIGDEWTEVSFGKGVDIATARERAQQILDALTQDPRP